MQHGEKQERSMNGQRAIGTRQLIFFPLTVWYRAEIIFHDSTIGRLVSYHLAGPLFLA